MLKLEDFEQQVAAYRNKWMIYDKDVYPPKFFVMLVVEDDGKELKLELIDMYEDQFDRYELYSTHQRIISTKDINGNIVGRGTIPEDNIFPIVKLIKK